jgi:3-oxoadipate enol-lactonase
MLAHQVALPDTTLAVRSRGSGMPVVLLHAFPLDGRMWAAQEPLAERVRLIVPDMRGFGGSQGPGPASIEQLADDTVALLDALHVREPAVVCGCSMGGYVVQHVAARHPDRVRAIVLVDTKLEADTPEARAARADLARQVERLGQEVVAAAMVPRLLAPPDTAPHPGRAEMERSLRAMIHGQPVATIQAALAALAARPDMTDRMRRMRSPALLVVGERDAITPPDCLRRAEEIMPAARLLVVPAAGHMVPLEAADTFNAALFEFLRELPARHG